MLSKSRLIRIEGISKEVERKAIWIADTIPVYSCQPYRKSKRLKGKVYVDRDHTRKQFYTGVKLGIIALPASAHDLNLLKIFYHETKETKGATIICSSLKPYPFHSPFPSSHSHG